MSNLSIIHTDLDTGTHATAVQPVVEVVQLSQSRLSVLANTARSIIDAQTRFADKLLFPSARLPVGKNFPLTGKILPGLGNLLPLVPSATCTPVATSAANNHAHSGQPKPVKEPARVARLTPAFLEF